MPFSFWVSWIILLLVYPFSTVSGEGYCATDSNVTFVSPDVSGPQFGNANQLKDGNLKLPWPRVGNFHLVRYCWADILSMMKLNCPLEKAIQIWSDALGGDGLDSGHSVRWQRTTRLVQSRNKFVPKMCFEEPGLWDPTVDADVLQIRYAEGQGPSATVGYTPEKKDSLAGRHYMVLPGDIEPHRLAHELGHVLGMVHEQCRGDRDQFVEVRCEKTRGFTHSLTSAILNGENPDKAREMLCRNKVFAKKYQFDGAEYIKNDDVPNIDFIMDEGSFDYWSIMLYPPNTFAEGDCRKNLDECPMVAIDRVDGKVAGHRPININVAPSARDVAFVRNYYPWIKPVPHQGPPQNIVKTRHSKKPRSKKPSMIREHRFDISRNGNISLRDFQQT